MANGSIHFLSFFLHRLLFETASASFEALLAMVCAYFILDFNPLMSRFLIILPLYILYYNAVVSLYLCLFSTRLGRPEARAASFLIQTFLALTSGLWIHQGDTLFYYLISWLQWLNPMYWTFSTFLTVNATGLGECLQVDRAGICRATVGDLFLRQTRPADISPYMSLLATLLIWIVIRLFQLGLIARDANYFSKSKKSL